MIVATADPSSISADNEGDFHAKTFAHDSGVNIISWLPNSTFFLFGILVVELAVATPVKQRIVLDNKKDKH